MTQPAPTPPDPQPDDPHLWLEEIDGEQALAWVGQRNAETAETVASWPSFTRTEREILEVLDSSDKIPFVSLAGGHLYNVWRDSQHERGLWRRTTLSEYRSGEPTWEVLLDVDQLNADEGADWVWHGAQVLRTGPHAYRRALIDLSRGGSDADVTREFDLVERHFIEPEEGGFHRGESKGGLSWIDADTVYLTSSTDGEPTASGYASRVRRWQRGQAWQEAEIVFEVAHEDLGTGAAHERTPGFERDWVVRSIDFYHSELFEVRDGATHLVEVPTSASAGVHREWLTVELREDWAVGGRTHPAGSLLAIDYESFLAGARDFTAVFTPTPSTALVGGTWTRHHLLLEVLEDVKSRVLVLTPPTGEDRDWRPRPLGGVPEIGTVSVAAVDPLGEGSGEATGLADALWLTSTDYLSPTTLSLVTLGEGEGEAGDAVELLRRAPAMFDADTLVAEQHFATSRDGTRVPYVVVRDGARPLDGTTPTLLYGYGGFEISLTPAYSATTGRGWLAQGGAYVVANIRGGGEYGPTWHQAALKENRHRAYEDCAAVARDLIDRGITSPPHLGVKGGSNGGLLAGNMLTQYPELFGAVVIQVPLLDMRRYHRLLAGASWMAEYGDPDDATEWQFMRAFSPYHLFDANRSYPPTLITTSTRDDRVHPGHARKMSAMMMEAGADVTYFENIEGGHAGAATNAQSAYAAALAFEFLRHHLA
ncbi:prolyl oligopeptidase family serine peptidase [Serinibacter salmoneus]|uniref:Prolyl oligopeptidase n=1 Tax=Serinibacter salmoneus TaxID=556530 RepID=A0A2A9D4Q9_9MICO|nr:prolyl oligopeptidase family serine peptidase [Serinibacter salmoneus]PFG20839.1 prolyl oligopeptidase [Serinibacter salmoneus]